MSDKLDNLYRDILMDHYKFPRGNKPLPMANLENEGHNPSCGDDIVMRFKLDGDKIEDVSVDCMGCAISVASGSMLAEIVKGKSVEEVLKIAKVVKAMLKGEDISTETNGMDLGDLEALRGVNKFPVRIKCALLSWTTMMDALKSKLNDNNITNSTTEQ